LPGVIPAATTSTDAVATRFGDAAKRFDGGECRLGRSRGDGRFGLDLTCGDRLHGCPSWPAEDKVRRIAEIIGHDPDELLALAGRVASDLTEIIRRRPREMADFLRAAKGLSAEDIARFARQAQKAKEK
jgi:hypothetical protein